MRDAIKRKNRNAGTYITLCVLSVFVLIPIIYMAVSYTHLDVYKRQQSGPMPARGVSLETPYENWRFEKYTHSYPSL